MNPTSADHRPGIDTTVIAGGAAAALLVAVPAVIVQNVAGGGLRSAAFLVSLAGFGLGGWVAGRRRLDRPLTHGGLAGLAAGCALLAVGIARRASIGESIAWPNQVLLAMLAFSCGALGAYVAFRRSRTRRQEPGS